MRRGTDIDRAASVLRGGGLVAFPTETVYGLGADASSSEAIRLLYKVKRRPAGHPLIVHLGDGVDLEGWAAHVPAAARVLAEHFWPGPLTMVMRRGQRIVAEATGGLDSVGLRVPAHPLALRLLAAFGGGVAAPSANRFGQLSPTTADHVESDLGDEVDYILDGGPCEVGVESTIVGLTGAVPALLRPGGAPREELERALGVRLVDPGGSQPRVSGSMPSHYAPNARVVAVVPGDLALAVRTEAARGRVAVMALTAVLAHHTLPAGVRVVALPDDLGEAARLLYAALRGLDDEHVDVIVAALPPEVGLGAAIADRLRRAAGPRDPRT